MAACLPPRAGHTSQFNCGVQFHLRDLGDSPPDSPVPYAIISTPCAPGIPTHRPHYLNTQSPWQQLLWNSWIIWPSLTCMPFRLAASGVATCARVVYGVCCVVRTCVCVHGVCMCTHACVYVCMVCMLCAWCVYGGCMFVYMCVVCVHACMCTYVCMCACVHVQYV